MREYLFRGKSILADTPHTPGYWLEGYLVESENARHIIVPKDNTWIELDGDSEVWPETVGQWTGLFDKKGNKIFEGDIIATRTDAIRTEKLKGYYGYDKDGYPQKVPGYEGYTEYHYACQKDCVAVVEYSACGHYYLRGANKAVNAICNEIVGNIHDNPELLKGE